MGSPLNLGCSGISPQHPGSRGITLEWTVPSTLGVVGHPPQHSGLMGLPTKGRVPSDLGERFPRHSGSRGLPPRWGVPSTLGEVGGPPDTLVQGDTALEGESPRPWEWFEVPQSPWFEGSPTKRGSPLESGCGGMFPRPPGSRGLLFGGVVSSTLGVVGCPPDTPGPGVFPFDGGVT